MKKKDEGETKRGSKRGGRPWAGPGGGTSRNTNLSSVRKSLSSKNVDKKRYIYFIFYIHNSLTISESCRQMARRGFFSYLLMPQLGFEPTSV